MINTSEALKDKLKSGKLDITVKINLLNRYEMFMEELTPRIIDGNISVDKSREIRRNFTLTIDNYNNEYTPKPNGKIWFDKRVQILIGITLNDGSIEWIPQGIFCITKPVVSNGANGSPQLRIEGLDKTATWGKISNTLYLQKGVKITEAIQQVLDSVEYKYLFDDSTDTVPYDITYPIGTERRQIIKELADMVTWDIGYNVYGELAFKPHINTDNAVITWTYQPEKYSLFASSEKEIDDTELYNHVITIGASSQTSTVIGEATHNDLASPFSIPNIGDRLYIHNGGTPDPLITTKELAEARSDYELRTRLQYIEKQRMQIAPNYIHEEGDVILLIDNDTETNNKYELLRFNIPLNTSGMMDCEAWRVKNVW